MLKTKSSNTPPIPTTFLLLLTASICHILPRFAYSVIALTISAAATYLANRGKAGQTNATGSRKNFYNDFTTFERCSDMIKYKEKLIKISV